MSNRSNLREPTKETYDAYSIFTKVGTGFVMKKCG